MKTDRLKKEFTEFFGAGREPEIYRAPGRVNLIGEHTDYNDGLVLPIAIDLSTYGLFRLTNEDKIRVYSENLDKFEEIELANLSRRKGNWTDYVRGVLSSLESRSKTISGFDLYLSSEIPVGSGLSSSAALEVVTAVGAIKTMNLDEVEDLDLIKLCQKAENDFVGANTGIMDQYASYLGREGAGLLINTAEPSHKFVDLGLKGYELLVIDTTVSHTHDDNEYNRRRRDCERAVNAINESTAGKTLKSLSDIPSEELDDILPQLEESLANRTEHVVRENERVEKAAGFFQQGRIKEVGELFFASHDSLRDLYEVSSPELDYLIEFARAEGIPGARMTGGGFGGSTIHLVPESQMDEYLKKASRVFEEEFEITPDGFPVSPSDGAKFQN
ncbi:galactokinase [Candidatus Bipolaricaulota bacterium]|nr:galactokinase [Candidatus Bipolaricaulota bacterium]MBS3791179.1 galactokinase [Candidatus Bipolaricaulota bacterium]